MAIYELFLIFKIITISHHYI